MDGRTLVSGSNDGSVQLWDVQIGGIVKTFHGHTGSACSVSISLDYTISASGSSDNTIHLWNTQTGKCYCVIDRWGGAVKSLSFSPTNPQLLTSASYDHTMSRVMRELTVVLPEG